MKRPFTLQEARAAGLSRHALGGRSWRRIGRGLYSWIDLPEDPWKLLAGWAALLPRDAVFAGTSAAWLHGLDFDPVRPAEVIVRPHSGVRSRRGLVVRHGCVDAVPARGLFATSVHRTLSDLCRRLPEVEALVALDGALRMRLTEKATLSRIHALGSIAEAAESPMETRLRWLLLQAGLPRPEVQRDLNDAHSRFVGRADLYYPAARLVIEYDGANHKERLVEDNRRQNRLINAGFCLLRFTASDVNQRAEAVSSQVRQALLAPVAPGRASRTAPPTAAGSA